MREAGFNGGRGLYIASGLLTYGAKEGKPSTHFRNLPLAKALIREIDISKLRPDILMLDMTEFLNISWPDGACLDGHTNLRQNLKSSQAF